MHDQYELYYTTYHQERERVHRIYSTLKSEESQRMIKSNSLNQSLQKAVQQKQESQKVIKLKAHKFNIKARSIQKKNNVQQEQQFLQIIKQKNELLRKEIELEHRLNLMNEEQSELIRQNQAYKQMKQKIYQERIEQHQQKVEEEHQQILKSMNLRFEKVNEYVQSTKDCIKQKFKNLSSKYIKYKEQAASIIEERNKAIFQDALQNMIKREQNYDKYLETKEKERKKIVYRNKLELVKFRKNKIKQSSIERIIQPKKEFHPIAPQIIVLDPQDSQSNQIEVFDVPYSEDVTFDKVLSSKRQLPDQSINASQDIDIQIPIDVVESQKFHKIKVDKQKQYEILMKLRMSVKKERLKLEQELNSFFLSQHINTE